MQYEPKRIEINIDPPLDSINSQLDGTKLHPSILKILPTAIIVRGVIMIDCKN